MCLWEYLDIKYAEEEDDDVSHVNTLRINFSLFICFCCFYLVGVS